MVQEIKSSSFSKQKKTKKILISYSRQNFLPVEHNDLNLLCDLLGSFLYIYILLLFNGPLYRSSARMPLCLETGPKLQVPPTFRPCIMAYRPSKQLQNQLTWCSIIHGDHPQYEDFIWASCLSLIMATYKYFWLIQ